MIKIVSGRSIPVGSTLALVRLCNRLNQEGLDCVFYGPDRWHLDQCRGEGIAGFRPETGDTVILQGIRLFSAAGLERLPETVGKPETRGWRRSLHRLLAGRFDGPQRHPGLRLILSCQEAEDACLRRSQFALFDRIHYVSATQIPGRLPAHAHFVCPNLCDPLVAGKERPAGVAGVIGSIRSENRVHESIEAALQEGMETVLLFGYLDDPLYFNRTIQPLTKKYPGRIRLVGFIGSRQRMYDSVSDVYCRPRKPWSLIEQECRLTGTRYHGPALPDAGDGMTADAIMALWRQALT
jgi:hypothetical protein